VAGSTNALTIWVASIGLPSIFETEVVTELASVELFPEEFASAGLAARPKNTTTNNNMATGIRRTVLEFFIGDPSFGFVEALVVDGVRRPATSRC
jgi:hypothetical protein